MQNIILAPPKQLSHWLHLYILYRKTFPPAERKPFSAILKKHRTGSADIWCILEENRFLGFASTMNSPQMVMLDYLAVRKQYRSCGIGSIALRQLMQHYADRAFLLEIENPYKPGPDQLLRQRRKQFYVNCGMEPLRIMAEVYGVQMELLGKNCSITFEAYRNFYRDFYKPQAARHILPAEHPEQ